MKRWRWILALLVGLWIVAAVAHFRGAHVPAWNGFDVAGRMATGFLLGTLAADLMGWAARRSMRRRLERERAEFLAATERGFVNGRGMISRRPRS